MKISILAWLQKEKLQLNVDQLQKQPQKEKLLEKLQLEKQLQREKQQQNAKQLQREKQQKDDNLVCKLTIVIQTTNCFHFSNSFSENYQLKNKIEK